jgi:hypothetical protein
MEAAGQNAGASQLPRMLDLRAFVQARQPEVRIATRLRHASQKCTVKLDLMQKLMRCLASADRGPAAKCQVPERG